MLGLERRSYLLDRQPGAIGGRPMKRLAAMERAATERSSALSAPGSTWSARIRSPTIGSATTSSIVSSRSALCRRGLFHKAAVPSLVLRRLRKVVVARLMQDIQRQNAALPDDRPPV